MLNRYRKHKRTKGERRPLHYVLSRGEKAQGHLLWISELLRQSSVHC